MLVGEVPVSGIKSEGGHSDDSFLLSITCIATKSNDELIS